MRKPICRMITLIILIAGLSVGPVANPIFAQEIPNQQSKIDPTQLKSFARVYVEFEKIRDTYEPRLSKAQGDQEAQVIQKEAGAKVDEALAKEGSEPRNLQPDYQHLEC